MNKGVIVQLDYNTAHILRNDGSFVSCPRDMLWQVGDVVTIPRRMRFSLKTAVVLFAALLILIIVPAFVIFNIPATYIEISVNPSVQLTLNRFDRVLSAEGLNDEAVDLLQGVSYKNLTLEEAYARLLNRLENNGFLSDATVQLVVANNSQRDLDGIEQVLRSVSAKYTQANNIRMSIKRYANDEYLALSHPLPIAEIPDVQRQEPMSPEPKPEPTPATQPTAAPTTAPTPTPTTTPSTQQHNGNGHNGNMHGGMWQDGWWDWDCD